MPIIYPREIGMTDYDIIDEIAYGDTFFNLKKSNFGVAAKIAVITVYFL